MRSSGLCIGLLLLSACAQETRTVIVVTLDGMRWQEVFGGADPSLMTPKTGGVSDRVAGPLKDRFWRDTPSQRREALMPFLWSTIATRGQVFGDPALESPSRLTNGFKFSYPGYNELLTGFPDPRIDSNDKVPNPNVTVLEWLNSRAKWKGRVSIVGSWDVLPSIVNTQRSGLRVIASNVPGDPPRTGEASLDEWAADLPEVWAGGWLDAVTMRAAMNELRTRRPRVLYVLLGDTDEWAHHRRYDQYLRAANRADDFIRRLWEAAQSMPSHAGKTSLIMTTDHGRGNTAEDWTNHGEDVDGAEYIWIAVLGPDTPSLGVRRSAPTTQSQVAATIAALLGEDYNAAKPRAALPLLVMPESSPPASRAHR